MLCKLIFKNVRKNLSDYLIYFITIMIAVSLFYAFNSIGTQKAFVHLSLTKGFLAKQLGIFISLLSYIIAVVLAFFIIYVNQFLLKRRKKELGIYSILGMDTWKISCIFVGETFIIGIVALVFGLALGFILSQGLSMFSLKLFAADLSTYKIVFSKSAVSKTILCFAIVFLIVMIFNVRTASKAKLIDMIKADSKNEYMILKNKWISLIILILSLVMLTAAGYFINRYSIKIISHNFKTLSALFILGTAMFFYSFSSMTFEIIKGNKLLYLKNLNTFLTRQLSSKIQSNFLSMTVVCILLTLTICIVSAGLSVALTMNSCAQKSSPYDITVAASFKKTGDIDICEMSQKIGFPLKDYLKGYTQISVYYSDFKYKDMFKKNDISLRKVDEELPESAVNIVSVTDFNNVMKLQGKSSVSLNDNEFLLNCNYKGTESIMKNFLIKDGAARINGVTLKAKQKKLISETVIMTRVNDNDRGTLIVPDYLVKDLKKDYIILNGVYKSTVDPETVVKLVAPLNGDINSGIAYNTKSSVYDIYYGTQAVTAFLCCYIGLIFSIICAALLALQQLTETEDNVKRYNLLKKLGTDEKLISETLFKQIAVYFAVPLILASIFSIIGIKKIMEILVSFLNMDVSANVFLAVILIAVIYGGYFIATYYSCRKMISGTDI